MNRKLLSGVFGLGLVLAEVASCSIDPRDPSTTSYAVFPGDASAPLPGEISGDPLLGVEPTTLDLGQAVIGSPSRSRVAVVNTGTGALQPAQVGMLMGSDPDFIVLHNQCENRLGAAERCDVRVQIVPADPGPSSATLGIDTSGQGVQVPLAAVALAAGPLIVAPAAGSSGDFGGVVLGERRDAFFDVSNPLPDNSGSLGIVVNEAQFQLLPPAAGECQVGLTTLANGQSCRIHVAFSPTRRGATDALLVVTSPNLGSTGLSLAGTGSLAPVLGVPDVVDFGNVVVGGAGQRTLRIENQGDEPLPLAGVTLLETAAAPAPALAGTAEAPTSAFSMTNSDCGGGKVLDGGGFCSVTVAFRPQLAEPNQQTQLVVTAVDGTEKPVALVGGGLSEGTLRISPAAGSTGDFGGLVVGTSATQVFTVSNPSQQPSGGLAIAVFDDFALVPPAAETDCQPGITSLAGDQSCSIAVTLTPSNSGQHDGALTVASSLAGAVHLPLTGRGVSTARLELASEQVDFGRVPTQTPIQQVVTLTNTGEQPVSGLQALLEGPGGAEAAGFTIQTPCAAELGVGASCDVGIQFLPTEAATYSAVLRLASPAATTSVLLLGSAFPRGNLQLTALGGTGDFGDVVLGMPQTQQFSLNNGGTTPSGRLTITSTNNLFSVALGDCLLEGLNAGASCTLSVTFTPATSDQIAANLSVQSPAAGETALSLSGRGRAAPNLTATNTRDLGRANVNQEALREPANQFTWTITNEGDLDSGSLAISNTNETDFIISNDVCNAAAVAGGGTCTMDIRFKPTAFGTRTATITVTDTVTAQALSLVLTGTGVVIAQPGQSCVNAECAAPSQCTGGVCCDRECVSACQECSAAGVCVDQAERQQCGNGNGQCFGVDRCLLPESQPCTGDDQCGSGQCEQRLGGTGLNDRICCLADCAATGQQCNAQGQCQTPTLPEGAACGTPGGLQCATGLQCKQCRGGGSQCTPPDGCCGGCVAGYTCNAGTCGCPQGNGPQLDCGPGVCFQNRENACCPATPDCPANLPVCDGSIGLCRQCLQAADCAPGPTGTFRACTNFQCVYACSTQEGFKDCGGGRCVQNNQCCGNQDCQNCQTCGANGFCGGGCNTNQVCNNNTNTCAAPASVGLGAACGQAAVCTAQAGLTCNGGTCQCNGQQGFISCGNGCVQQECCGNDASRCGNGEICSNGTCAPPASVGLGAACGAAALCTAQANIVCAGGTCVCNSDFGFIRCANSCVEGECCDTEDCTSAGGPGLVCNGSRRCVSACNPPLIQGSQRCGLANGEQCSVNGDCANGNCTRFFVDIDGDDFGSGSGLLSCVTQPALPLTTGSYKTNGGDCCDIQQDGSNLVYPGAFYLDAPPIFPEACTQTPFGDFDCDGVADPL